MQVPAWPGEIDAGTVSPLPTARSARAYHVEGAAPADKEAIDAFQMAQYAGGAWGGDDLLELFVDYVYDGENDGASGFAGGRETLSLKEAPSPFGLRAAVNGMVSGAGAYPRGHAAPRVPFDAGWRGRPASSPVARARGGGELTNPAALAPPSRPQPADSRARCAF